MSSPYLFNISIPCSAFDPLSISNSPPNISVNSSQSLSESSIISILNLLTSLTLLPITFLSFSVTTIFFLILALYINLSAFSTAFSIGCPPEITPPILTDNLSLGYPGTLVLSIVSLMCFIFLTKVFSSIPGITIRNSSPPYLIIKSVFLISFFITLTTVFSATSPAICPNVSLYNLKSSRSNMAIPETPVVILIFSS